MKFVNALAKAAADLNLPKDNELSAYQFHADLFLSGFERYLLVPVSSFSYSYPYSKSPLLIRSAAKHQQCITQPSTSKLHAMPRMLLKQGTNSHITSSARWGHRPRIAVRSQWRLHPHLVKTAGECRFLRRRQSAVTINLLLGVRGRLGSWRRRSKERLA
jgi:hypothetical protein